MSDPLRYFYNRRRPLSEVRKRWPGDTMTVRNLPDGFRIVRLLTPAALDAEAAMMGHCLGSEEYREMLEAPDVTLYSLRDARNRAHVTMEVWCNMLMECAGKQNTMPVDRYMPHIQAFIEYKHLELSVELWPLGLTQVDGRWRDGARLPDGLEVYDHLILSGPRVTRLPERMTVRGGLTLIGTNVTRLPETLVTPHVVVRREGHLERPPGVGKVTTYRCGEPYPGHA